MLFDKAIRKRQQKLLPTENEIFEGIVHSGRSELCLSPKTLPQEYLKEAEWPEFINLRVSWETIPYTSNCKAQETVNGKVYKPCRVYDPDSTNASIVARSSLNKGIRLKAQDIATLVYKDHKVLIHIGQDSKANFQLPFNQTIFETFGLTLDENIFQSRDSLARGQWLVLTPKLSESKLNHVSVFGYGLYAVPGCSLNDIEQIFASISSEERVGTKINLYKQSYLKSLGLSYPKGGIYRQWFYEFIDRQSFISPSQVISSGSIKIQVRKSNQSYEYTSIEYQQIDQESQLIDLVFKFQKKE